MDPPHLLPLSLHPFHRSDSMVRIDGDTEIMYTKIQTGSITVASDRIAPGEAVSQDTGNINRYSSTELTSQDESSLEMYSRSSEGEIQDGSDVSSDDEEDGKDNVHVETPIFDNPLRNIDLDADIQEFLATKRISDVILSSFQCHCIINVLVN